MSKVAAPGGPAALLAPVAAAGAAAELVGAAGAAGAGGEAAGCVGPCMDRRLVRWYEGSLGRRGHEGEREKRRTGAHGVAAGLVGRGVAVVITVEGQALGERVSQSENS